MVRKILSIDVGIVNLAYCVLEINDDNKFKINYWDIINISSKKETCNFSKKGSVCNSVATKTYDGKYYCTPHSKKIEVDTRNINIEWIKSDKTLCTYENCKNKECFKTELIEGHFCQKHCKTMIIKNNYRCKKCNELSVKGIYQENVFITGWCKEHINDCDKHIKSKIKKVTNNISPQNMCHNLIKKLDEKKELLNVNEIFIENQPTFKNPIMKSIAVMIHTYFVMKTNNVLINYCSPSNKIKMGGQNVVDKIKEVKDDRETYVLTKETSKKICRELIKDEPDYVELFDKHKKQDDMADSFLQGLIMGFKSVIPQYYVDIIKGAEL
jgi:hypothetical protein